MPDGDTSFLEALMTKPDKGQEARKSLDVGGPREAVDDSVGAAPARRAFLKRRGTIHVSPGSVVEDVRRARAQRSKAPQQGSGA